MSDLGFLEKLLDGADVGWVPLGNLGELVRGNGLPKADFTETGVPAIHYGQIYTFYGLSTASTISFVSDETAATLKKVNSGDVVITNTSENYEDVGTPLVYFGKEQAVTGGHATVFKPIKSVLGMYFAYFALTQEFDSAKRKYAKGAKVIDVSAKDMAKILVPIPCPEDPEKSLAIQAEIVRILDAFTVLTAELTAELGARKRQYNHYRDHLLAFEDGDVEWRTLGEVFNISAGGDAPKDAMSKVATDEFKIPILSNGKGDNSLYGWTNRAKVEEPSLTVSARGTIGWTSFRNEPFFPIVRLIVLTPKTGVNLKYAYYFMKTIENNYRVPPAGIPQLTKPMIEGTLFPVPCPNDPEKSLEEQARIVAILDKFDTLTTSLSEGLPREIKLRQQQCEYYHDLLLSFPKPVEVE